MSETWFPEKIGGIEVAFFHHPIGKDYKWYIKWYILPIG